MKRRVIMSFFLAVYACAGAYAMAGSEHARLWNEVFGIRDGASQEKIQPLWDAAQEVIDNYVSDYRELRRNFGWFTWGSYGHRLLFHWGFNADPKKYAPLVRQVRTCLKENHNAKEEEQKFFAYLTSNIQSRRNRKLINFVTSATGIPTARGYSNAIATIIYDIHLLGDYSTVNTSALPSIDSIEHDLMDNGFRRLITGGDKSSRLEALNAELQASTRAGRGRVNSKRAQLLTETVKKYLPAILTERFSKTLSDKGITIAVHE